MPYCFDKYPIFWSVNVDNSISKTTSPTDAVITGNTLFVIKGTHSGTSLSGKTHYLKFEMLDLNLNPTKMKIGSICLENTSRESWNNDYITFSKLVHSGISFKNNVKPILVEPSLRRSSIPISIRPLDSITNQPESSSEVHSIHSLLADFSIENSIPGELFQFRFNDFPANGILFLRTFSRAGNLNDFFHACFYADFHSIIKELLIDIKDFYFSPIHYIQRYETVNLDDNSQKTEIESTRNSLLREVENIKHTYDLMKQSPNRSWLTFRTDLISRVFPELEIYNTIESLLENLEFSVNKIY